MFLPGSPLPLRRQGSGGDTKWLNNTLSVLTSPMLLGKQKHTGSSASICFTNSTHLVFMSEVLGMPLRVQFLWRVCVLIDLE